MGNPDIMQSNGELEVCCLPRVPQSLPNDGNASGFFFGGKGTNVTR